MKKNAEDMQKLWKRIVTDLKKQGKIGMYGLDAISKLTLKQDTGSELIVEYPETLMIDWVEINYLDFMVESATRLLQASRQFVFVMAGTSSPLPSKESEETVVAVSSAATASPRKNRRSSRTQTMISGLNEDYRFDNFIVGDNNAYAYNVAHAVARSGSEEHPYNPLFIHGDSGMGKTHLLQAIGNEIRSLDEKAQVLYVTGEDFTNAYIDAIARKGEALSSFRRKYRRADVLLIDDVQFMARAGKTQEEFFHTFNALFESGKQIVLCADCPAREIIHMDARLTSRFEQGLTVCLKAPCYETRLAILRHKMRQWRSNLVGDDVLEFLARHITTSVRTLEGALTRVASIASFSRRQPTVAETRLQLKDLLTTRNTGKVTIDDIQQAVAETFGVRVADLNGRRRTASIAYPRQVAMYLARRHTQNSLQDIGAAFGGRDHGTVIHAARAIESRLKQDPELESEINRVAEALSC